MVPKNNRQNTDFQLAYFIAGSCKTADGAWSVLQAQKKDMEKRIASAKASRLRLKIRKNKIDEMPESTEEEELEKEASLIEYNSDYETFLDTYRGAEMELDTINDLIERIEPYCQFDTSDYLVHQEQTQRLEWQEELKARGENMTLSNILGIPYDHLNTMRMHPDFSSEILPHINKTRQAINQSNKSRDDSYILNFLNRESESLPHNILQLNNQLNHQQEDTNNGD